MNNENEEEKNEEDKDAEEAYLKVSSQSCQRGADDNEFDYDENVFITTNKGCEKYVNSEENGSPETNNVFESINVNGTSDCTSDETLLVKEDNPDVCTSPNTNNKIDRTSSNVHCEIPEIEDGAEKDLSLHWNSGEIDNGSAEVVAEWKKEHEAATEEWSNVIEITSEEASTAEIPYYVSSEPVLFSETIGHFQSMNLSEYHDKIRPCIQRTGIAAFCYSLVGPVSLNKILLPERDFIFTLALLTFDNNDAICNRILYTVYKGLTKIKVDCPRYGKHWENIGFQGNDPTTDLRGCGMLGLLTTLHLITSSKTSTLASLIYHLSQDEMQNFPFCVMSINVTRISLQILREGKINKECNKRFKLSRQTNYQVGKYTGVVYDVFQDLFVSIFNRIYLTWKNEYKTMADSGFVLSDIESYAKKKPIELMKSLRKEKTQSSSEKIESFVGVDEL